MAAPSPSWNLVRVYGTWHKQDGSLRPGKFKVTVPVRVTNSTDDTIIPAGVYASGDLQTADPMEPSLDVLVPATDDPDNEQTGWKLQVEVTFPDASAEKYVIDVPVADRPVDDGGTGDGVNLRTVALSQNLPQQQATYRVGVPGGLAKLNGEGKVVDADGNPVTGDAGEGVPEGGLTGQVLAKASNDDFDTEWIDPPEGGSDGGGGPVTWDDVLDKPSTFEPAEHTHTMSDVTGLSTALDGKAAASHTHDDRYYTETEVNNLIANLDADDVGALPASYTPSISDLPAGVMMAALYDSEEGWPERPAGVRTDIVVTWIDYTGESPLEAPPEAIAGVDHILRPSVEESE